MLETLENSRRMKKSIKIFIIFLYFSDTYFIFILYLSRAKRRRVASKGGSGTTSIQKEGNTYRLKDNDSDDENNTWNGNSTQQM